MKKVLVSIGFLVSIMLVGCSSPAAAAGGFLLGGGRDH